MGSSFLRRHREETVPKRRREKKFFFSRSLEQREKNFFFPLTYLRRLNGWVVKVSMLFTTSLSRVLFFFFPLSPLFDFLFLPNIYNFSGKVVESLD